MENEHHEHHEHNEHHEHHKKENATEKLRNNPWIISTFVLGILALILIFSSVSGGITGKTISEDKAAELVLGFANAQGVAAELVDVNEVGNFYEVSVLINGQKSVLSVTKDGEYLAQLIPLSLFEQEPPTQQEPANQKIVKSDVPEVELFVMTHCPYGTQAEKGLLPTVNALGNTINSKIRFVHYYMHTNNQEEVETPKQVCIREEQPDKWHAYLKCFLDGDGNADSTGYIANGNDPFVCMQKVGVDKSAVEECISSGRADEYYKEDSDLSNGYGVGGSPTLVLNGVQSNAGRDAASYLDGICKAMAEPSELCGTSLSSTSPSPGFGYGEGSDTEAQC